MHKGDGLPLDGKPSSRRSEESRQGKKFREVCWTCRSMFPPRVKRWNLWPILGFPCIYDLNHQASALFNPRTENATGVYPRVSLIRVSSEKDRPSAGMPREHACGSSIHAQG